MELMWLWCCCTTKACQSIGKQSSCIWCICICIWCICICIWCACIWWSWCDFDAGAQQKLAKTFANKVVLANDCSKHAAFVNPLVILLLAPDNVQTDSESFKISKVFDFFKDLLRSLVLRPRSLYGILYSFRAFQKDYAVQQCCS